MNTGYRKIEDTGGTTELSSDLTPVLGGNLSDGGFTIDGRDVSADGTKLDTIETNADVTDATNVISSLNGATISSATVATGDKVLIQDADASDALKYVTAQSIADLGTGGVGSRVLIASQTASSSATLDFDDCFSATYSRYEVEIINLKCATDGVELIGYLSTNSGSSWLSSVYSAVAYGTTSSGAAWSRTTTSHLVFMSSTTTQGNAADESLSLTGYISGPFASTLKTHIHGTTIWNTDSGVVAQTMGFANSATAAEHDSIRFQYGSGNIASGTIRIYGIKE